MKIGKKVGKIHSDIHLGTGKVLGRMKRKARYIL